MRSRVLLCLLLLALLEPVTARAAGAQRAMTRVELIERLSERLRRRPSSAITPPRDRTAGSAGAHVVSPAPSGSLSEQFAIPGLDDTPICAAFTEDGLVVAGAFQHADGQSVRSIALWDGHAWHAMGQGFNGRVFALTTWKGRLVAGGCFDAAGGTHTGPVAIWSGSDWEPLGTDIHGCVDALAADESTLVIGGGIDHVGSLVAGGVARWNGVSWDAMGGGTDGVVHALTAYAGGFAVGGQFQHAGGVAAANIARWNGSGWSALGSGLSGGGDPYVIAMARLGSEILVGGFFDTAGTAPAGGLARWNGASWQALAGAPDQFYTTALETDGDVVHIGGYAPNGGSGFLARWDGASFTTDPEAPDNIPTTIAAGGGQLAIGGLISTIAGQPTFRLGIRRDGRWVGADGWRSPMRGFPGDVSDLATDGTSVFVAGGFRFAADDTGWVAADGVARWDGEHWRAIGQDGPGPSSELIVEGEQLYAFGSVPWRWDGTRWSNVGGVPPMWFEHYAMYRGELWAVGECFFNCTAAGGLFRNVGGSWVNVPPPPGIPADSTTISALQVHDDQLEVAWIWTPPGQQEHTWLVPWNGSGWGERIADVEGGRVRHMATFRGRLCISGEFTAIDGQTQEGFSILGPSGWSRNGYPGTYPYSMTTGDSMLFVADYSVQSFDGTHWRDVFAGTLPGGVATMLATDRSLWMGGFFSHAGGTPSFSIARFDFPPPAPSPGTAIALSAGPSPTPGAVTLGYVLPEKAHVRLSVFDLMGRQLALLADSTQPAGLHQVVWGGGERVRAGVYFARLEVGGRPPSSRAFVIAR